MNSLLQAISKPLLRNRLAEIVAQRPEIEGLSYILGEDRMLEWAHTVGITVHERLRDALPPIPPEPLRAITAAPSEAVFLWSGFSDARYFSSLCGKYLGRAERPLIDLLDFGCGCGRMARFFAASAAHQLRGCDINDALISWCSANLDGAYTRNGAAPPLPYDDATFDAVSAFSVFSHFREAASLAWLAEIGRLLRPGGIAVLTTHGLAAIKTVQSSKVHQEIFGLTTEQAAGIESRMPAEGFVYHDCNPSGPIVPDADYGNAFIDESFIWSRWPRAGLQVLEFLPGGIRGWQDAIVLRRL